MKRLAAAAAALLLTAFGGSVGATGDDYPPGGTTATTSVGGGTGGGLPATGSDSDNTMQIAGGALVAGLGLLTVAKMRRRSAAA